MLYYSDLQYYMPYLKPFFRQNACRKCIVAGQMYTAGDGKRGIPSGGHGGKMLLKDGDSLKCLGGVDTLDDKFESNLTTTLGVGHTVGE